MLRYEKMVKISSIFLLAIVLLAWKRLELLFWPQVWAEDGTQVVARFVAMGWSSLFEPINGYVTLIPKLVSFLSMDLSFYYYPAISIAIACCFIGAYVVFVWTGDFDFKYKSLWALAPFFVPVDPEVFGLSLYLIWWSSLVLFVLPFWRNENGWGVARFLVVVVTGLSSAVVIYAWPVYLMRAIKSGRAPSNWLVFVGAFSGATIQAYFVFKYAQQGGSELSVGVVLQSIPLVLGRFLVWWVESRWLVMLVGSGLIIFGVYAALKSKNDFVFWALIYILVASIFVTLRRVDFSIIHPAHAGARYFFLPFTVLVWIALQFFAQENARREARLFGGGLVLLSVISTLFVPLRQQDDLHWGLNVESCRFFDRYNVPIQTSGLAANAWYLNLSGAQCESFLGRDRFFSSSRVEKSYPYSVAPVRIEEAVENRNLASASNIDSGDWKGGGYDHSVLSGLQVVGSYVDSDENVGSVTLLLHRGQTVLFRGGPRSEGQKIVIEGFESFFLSDAPIAANWVLLDFSNKALPDVFRVTFVDRGVLFGQWSAIAVKK